MKREGRKGAKGAKGEQGGPNPASARLALYEFVKGDASGASLGRPTSRFALFALFALFAFLPLARCDLGLLR